MVIKPNNVMHRKKCPKCSGNHSYDKCQKVDKPICPNCKGDHSAGHKLCPKFVKVQNTLEISIKQKMSYAQAVKKLKETEEQKMTHQQTTPSVSEETATETKPITNNLTVLKKQPSVKNMETQTDVSTPTCQEQSSESKKTSPCSKEMNEVIQKLLNSVTICIQVLRKDETNNDLIKQVKDQVRKVINVDVEIINAELVKNFYIYQ